MGAEAQHINLKLQLSPDAAVEGAVLNKVHQLAKDQMINLYDYMRGVTIKLNVEVQSLDTLRYVVNG